MKWTIDALCCLGAAATLIMGSLVHLGFYWVALLLLTGWVCVRLADREDSRGPLRWLLPAVVGVICFWLLPDLSTDHHRYLWEGYVQNQGYSPYLHAPDTLFDRLEHPSEPHINHADLPAVYPPLAQHLFRIANLITRSVYGWKVLLVLGLLPLWFLGGPGQRTNRLLLFSPVVLFEGLWNGHLDVLGLVPAILMIDALSRRLPMRAGLLLGFLTALKIIPIVLLPFCGLHFKSRDRWLFLAGFTGLVVLCYLPYSGQLPHLFDSFITFSREWSFNNPLYHLLASTMAAATARMVMGLLLLLSLATAFFYREDVAWRCTAAWVAIYVFSPTLFPWYLMWLAVFTPPKRQVYAHLAYAAAFFSYLVLIPFRETGLWQERLYWMIPEWIVLAFCFYRILFPAEQNESTS